MEQNFVIVCSLLVVLIFCLSNSCARIYFIFKIVNYNKKCLALYGKSSIIEEHDEQKCMGVTALFLQDGVVEFYY